VSLGGRNNYDNFVIACLPCNVAKGKDNLIHLPTPIQPKVKSKQNVRRHREKLARLYGTPVE
jgi:5-methylcytosine-specific restriction endonuclease McrA